MIFWFSANEPDASLEVNVRPSGRNDFVREYLHRLEKGDVIIPDRVRIDVHADFFQSEIVCLSHLLPERGQLAFGITNIIQVTFPKVDIQNFDERSLEKLEGSEQTGEQVEPRSVEKHVPSRLFHSFVL